MIGKVGARVACGMVCLASVAIVPAFGAPATAQPASGPATAPAPPQCGQYCVHFVCQIHGLPLTIEQVCDLLPPKPGGETMAELYAALDAIGFRVEGKELSYEELLKEQVPLIAHVKPAHFMVVERFADDAVHVMDAASRRRRLRVEGFREGWTGYALTVARPEGAEWRPRSARGWKQGEPRLQFRTLFQDAGERPFEEKRVSYEFPFVNLGTGDLLISAVKTGCRCASASLVKTAYRPGEAGKLIVEYDLTAAVGPYGDAVLVTSNDPSFPLIKLNVAGVSARKLTLSPGELRLGRVSRGHAAKGLFWLRYYGDDRLEVRKVEATVPGTSVAIRSVTPGVLRELFPGLSETAIHRCQYENAYVGCLSLESSAGQGRNREGRLLIHTNLAGAPIVVLPFSCEVAPPVQSRPDAIFLGFARPGDEVRQVVELVGLDGRKFAVLSVDTHDTGLKCAYGKEEVVRSSLEFSGRARFGAPAEDALVTIHVRLAEGDVMDLRLPVYAYRID